MNQPNFCRGRRSIVSLLTIMTALFLSASNAHAVSLSFAQPFTLGDASITINVEDGDLSTTLLLEFESADPVGTGNNRAGIVFATPQWGSFTFGGNDGILLNIERGGTWTITETPGTGRVDASSVLAGFSFWDAGDTVALASDAKVVFDGRYGSRNARAAAYADGNGTAYTSGFGKGNAVTVLNASGDFLFRPSSVNNQFNVVSVNGAAKGLVYNIGALVPVANDNNYFLQENFDTDLSGWTSTVGAGSAEVAVGPFTRSNVLKLTSSAAEAMLSRTLSAPSANTETVFIEYDYRTESTDAVNDTVALNKGTGSEVLTNLLASAGILSVADNSGAALATEENGIRANTWHHIKLGIDPVADQLSLEIDGLGQGSFSSASDLAGIRDFLVSTGNGNTVYIDNIEVYSNGKGLFEPPTPNIPLPPNGHPRLFVNQALLLEQRARFNNPQGEILQGIKAKVVAQAAAADSGDLSVLTENPGRMNDVIYRAIDASALTYLMSNDQAAGEKAVRMILESLDTLEGSTGSGTIDREIHRTILSAAMVYDWCYELLTQSQRRSMISDVIRLAGSTEYSWPFSGNITYLVNHFGEEKVPDLLAFGIAAFQEDTSIYFEAADQLYNGLVPSRNAFYPAQKHHQGASYQFTRYDSEVLSTFLMARMGAENPYIEDQAKVLYDSIYSRRPDDIVMTASDDFNPAFISRANGSGHFGVLGAMMAANIYQESVIQDQVYKYISFVDEFTALDDGTLQFLYFDEKLEPSSLEELPLTRITESPITSLTARTGWDFREGASSNAVIATMDVGEYYWGNHDHLDAGHFSIYYKGNLAIDSGALAADAIGGCTFGGRCSQWANYYQRTIAHNTITVTDPTQPFTIDNGDLSPSAGTNASSTFDGINEGGQSNKVGTPFDFNALLAEGRQAEVLGKGFGPDLIEPDYSYMKSDMARAYDFVPFLRSHDLNSGRRQKVSEAKRSFTFLNLKNDSVPAAMIVLDKVTSAQPEFKKRWLLHSAEQPQVTGNVTEVRRTQGNPEHALGEGYSGKLVNYTLLPELDNLSIETVGGPGKEFFTASAREEGAIIFPPLSNEVVQNNRNWALRTESDIDKHDAGRWRIEVSPQNDANTDLFLNVLQVMDDNQAPLAVEKLDNQLQVGVQIADRVAMYSASGERLNETLTVTTGEASGDLKVLVADLVAGDWVVSGNLRADPVQVIEDAGTLYFTAPAGIYTLNPGNDVSVDTDGDGVADIDDELYLDPTISLIGDFSNDGDVDIFDLILFIQLISSGQELPQVYDFNIDGRVDFNDLRGLIQRCTNRHCSPHRFSFLYY